MKKLTTTEFKSILSKLDPSFKFSPVGKSGFRASGTVDGLAVKVEGSSVDDAGFYSRFDRSDTVRIQNISTGHSKTALAVYSKVAKALDF